MYANFNTNSTTCLTPSTETLHRRQHDQGRKQIQRTMKHSEMEEIRLSKVRINHKMQARDLLKIASA